MPDLQRIRRLGPEPQSFTRRQHQQQKPVGSCLTFQQLNRSDGKSQFQQLQHSEPQHFSDTSGQPQQLQLRQPQHFSDASGQPQQLQLSEPQQFSDTSGEPQQHQHRHQHSEPQQFNDASG